MSCPIKIIRNTIELKVHTSCYCVLDLLCVNLIVRIKNYLFTVPVLPVKYCKQSLGPKKQKPFWNVKHVGVTHTF